MEVHTFLGNGFQEVVYQRALAYEMELGNLIFKREVTQQLLYKGIDVGTRRADFLVNDNIIIELKAIINLEDVHLAQAKNYLVAYDYPVGLLINFGAPSLQYKRVFNQKYEKSNKEK